MSIRSMFTFEPPKLQRHSLREVGPTSRIRASTQRPRYGRWTGGQWRAGRHVPPAVRAGLLTAAALAGLATFAVSPAAAVNGTTGSVTAFGSARAYGAPPASKLAAPVVATTSTQDGKGYWLLGADGGVFTYGDAHFYGSEAASGVATPFVGIAPTLDGHGYWIAGDFGNVYSFGDAPMAGSSGVFPAAPVVGIAAASPTGYWLAAADGGVFSFGDARFYGSLGGHRLNAPVVGIVPTADRHGYWLVAADGGVFSFGDARFYGSLGATPPPRTTPVVGMAAQPNGAGYWLTTTDKRLPSPTPVPSVLDRCNQPTAGPVVEPSTIVLACGDGNALLTHLSWSSWTATTATGSGYYTHNTCTPNCALGTFVSVPASVRLSYPIQTRVGKEFASISYTFANPSAPGGSSTYALVAPTSPG
jgi:hypothetical protein